MQKIISYPISLIALLLFLLTLVIFHPIQWICFNLFGYQAHKKSVDCLNFVPNHQSLFDIIAIIWFFRKFHPKFVSKKELGRGVPSVSYNLRNGGSVLIDRKDPKQAVPNIKKLSEYIELYKLSAVIFPEGTRSKTGVPKEFSQTGLKILCKYAPSAFVVPLSINNSWKIFKYGFFPLGLGNHLTFVVHKPLSVKDLSFDELMKQTEQSIVQGIIK